MRHLLKVLVVFLVVFQTSCSSTKSTKTEADRELPWVAKAQQDLNRSRKKTERQLAVLRAQAKGIDSQVDNETWALYRLQEQVYGVRTEAGEVTGELIAKDATIVGPWVRVYGDFRTSGDGFLIQQAVSEGYANIR